MRLTTAVKRREPLRQPKKKKKAHVNVVTPVLFQGQRGCGYVLGVWWISPPPPVHLEWVVQYGPRRERYQVLRRDRCVAELFAEPDWCGENKKMYNKQISLQHTRLY